MFEQCRYNPLKDNGVGNKVYLKSIHSSLETTFQTLPTNKDLIIEEYPLWLIFWSWTDWLHKANKAQHIHEDYVIVVVSKFIEPKRTCYVFLDNFFRNPGHEESHITETDKQHWHPKYGMQTEMENEIALTGPASPKINHSKSIQCVMNYNVHVKWGGCPAPMETIFNPCEQEKYPTPNNINIRYEMQSPETAKESFLYQWDEREGTLTRTATKRITTYSSPKKSFTDYGTMDPPTKTLSEESDTTSEEEESEKELQSQLNKLKLRQRKFKLRLRQLTRRKLLC